MEKPRNEANISYFHKFIISKNRKRMTCILILCFNSLFISFLIGEGFCSDTDEDIFGNEFIIDQREIEYQTIIKEYDQKNEEKSIHNITTLQTINLLERNVRVENYLVYNAIQGRFLLEDLDFPDNIQTSSYSYLLNESKLLPFNYSTNTPLYLREGGLHNFPRYTANRTFNLRDLSLVINDTFCQNFTYDGEKAIIYDTINTSIQKFSINGNFMKTFGCG